MGNAVKGTVSREIDGQTVEFTLGANEWCELESELGKKTGAILKDLAVVAQTEEVDFHLFRHLFRAALSYSRPDATLRDAGTMMSKLGLEASGLLIAEIVQAGMPSVSGAPGKRKAAARKT